jgi:multiple sugar transport system ATP-binding protein
MRLEISKLHERLKTTIIYVTHDQVEAMTMGDRICVMKDGEIQQVAPPWNCMSVRRINLLPGSSATRP